MADLMEALRRAKREGRQLRIVYRGSPADITEHDITPLEWIVEDLFRAYCHTTGHERTFHVFSIVEWRWKDTPDGRELEDQPKPSDYLVSTTSITGKGEDRYICLIMIWWLRR